MSGIHTLSRMRESKRSEFGERLFQARMRAKLTQPELAADVGMAQGTLGEAESKGRSSGYTVRIARRCGVSALWLESGDGSMLDSFTWPFSLELLSVVSSLNTDGLGKLEGVMRAHLGMAQKAVQSLPDLSTQPATDQSVGRTTSRPVIETNTLLDNARVGGKRAASSKKSRGVQESRSGRGPKRAA